MTERDARNAHPIQSLEPARKGRKRAVGIDIVDAVESAERQGEPARIGSYEIVRKLARGGMADLFLARSVTASFERLVVIKKILPKYSGNPRFVQLFQDEAKLAASLNHKNIVPAFDSGGTGGESFFAMEYLHGQDLRSILHRASRRNEKLPIEHAVLIASQIASALHYAHEKRRPDGTLLELVHRDVSPSNIIVSYDGAVKLLDFGVAKAATSTIKTRTGTLKGKISYMSPEQAKGSSIDRRSDVFSLGIVLWEMVTTTRLFRGLNDLATLHQIISAQIKRPSSVNPECPQELERVVLRALAQDTSQRYQTAQEIAFALEDLVRQLQTVQSSTALGRYMNMVFQTEISSWHEAKAAGVELSEHLTKVQAHEETNSISESEFIEPDDDDDDDDDDDLDETLDAVSGTIEPPAPPQAGVPIEVSKVASGPAGRVVAIAHASNSGALAVGITTRATRDATPPPIPISVGRSARHDIPQPYSADRASASAKPVFYAGAAVLALIVVIAFVKSRGGGPEEPAPAPSTVPMEVTPASVGATADAAIAVTPVEPAPVEDAAVVAPRDSVADRPPEKNLKRPPVKKRPEKKPPGRKPPEKKKYDPNSPLPPR